MKKVGSKTTSFRSSRRCFLGSGTRLVVGGLAVAALGRLGGCAGETENSAAPPLRVELTDLPLDRPVNFEHRGDPVELLRSESGIRARSLLCTHRGCVVVWKAQISEYQCPCHEARFDAAGQPIAGPPGRPLAELPVTITGTTVVVGGSTEHEL